MPDLAGRIAENLAGVRSGQRIADAAVRSGRNAADAVRLVAVTKYVGLEEILAPWSRPVASISAKAGRNSFGNVPPRWPARLSAGI